MDFTRPVTEIIRARRSVRTFEKEPLAPEKLRELETLAAQAQNPFGIPVTFRLLDAKTYGLQSPVIVGADAYMAAKVTRGSLGEIAFGYSFETFCLLAADAGVGTVILAGTLNREAFEKAMEVGEDEVMPTATPVGVAAGKMSMREKMMRKGVKADLRLPFETLFFDGDFQTPLTPARAGQFAEALEMVRLAPSAVNRQPWRAVVCGNAVHFYKQSSKGMESGKLDIQKVDMGIALSHFDLTMREQGRHGVLAAETPALESGALTYIITYKLS